MSTKRRPESLADEGMIPLAAVPNLESTDSPSPVVDDDRRLLKVKICPTDSTCSGVKPADDSLACAGGEVAAENQPLPVPRICGCKSVSQIFQILDGLLGQHPLPGGQISGRLVLRKLIKFPPDRRVGAEREVEIDASLHRRNQIRIENRSSIEVQMLADGFAA